MIDNRKPLSGAYIYIFLFSNLADAFIQSDKFIDIIEAIKTNSPGYKSWLA